MESPAILLRSVTKSMFLEIYQHQQQHQNQHHQYYNDNDDNDDYDDDDDNYTEAWFTQGQWVLIE